MNWRKPRFWFMLVPGFALFYLASLAPAWWMIRHGVIQPGTWAHQIVVWYYAPLSWLTHLSPQFRDLILWYHNLVFGV